MELVIILDRIKGTAKDLADPRILGRPIRLRLEGDTDDPATWHPVKVISPEGFRADTGQPFVRAITSQRFWVVGRPQARLPMKSNLRPAVLG